jgi:hypothetical protein
MGIFREWVFFSFFGYDDEAVETCFFEFHERHSVCLVTPVTPSGLPATANTSSTMNQAFAASGTLGFWLVWWQKVIGWLPWTKRPSSTSEFVNQRLGFTGLCMPSCC